MPMIASLLLTYRERRWAGIAALLRRTYDADKIKPRVWFLPIFFVYPSLGIVNYWILRAAGADIQPSKGGAILQPEDHGSDRRPLLTDRCLPLGATDAGAIQVRASERWHR